MQISQASNMTFIDLGCNRIGSHHNIGKEGAAAIAEVLKVNSTLTSLDLGYNWIEKEDTVLIVEALKVNSTLTSLDLRGNNFGEEGSRKGFFDNDNNTHTHTNVLPLLVTFVVEGVWVVIN